MITILAQIVAMVFMLVGIVFFIAATVGILRMPCPYTRGHVAGKGDSPGFLFSLAGLWVYWLTVNPIESIKILVIIIFMLFVNPIVIHILLRYCRRAGVKPCPETTFHLLDTQMTADKDNTDDRNR